MRPQLKSSRLVVSLVALVIVMSSAPARAQSKSVPAEQPLNPGPSRTIVSINDIGDELPRPQVFTRPFLDPGEGLAQAPSTGHSAKRDSLLNGVLIGAGIGAVLGLIPDYYDDCEECHDSLYASIAVGAGIGLVVDLLRSNTKPTSRPVSGQRFRLDIDGGRRTVGIRGIVRWR